MKKLLITAALLTISNSIVLAEKPIPLKETLLPELKAMFEPKSLDHRRLQNNFVVQAQGILYPRDNWQTIYGEVLKQNDDILFRDLTAQKISYGNYYSFDYSLSSDLLLKLGSNYYGTLKTLRDYLNSDEALLTWKKSIIQNDQIVNWHEALPCRYYGKPNCVLETIENKKNIEPFINQNRELLDRYQRIIDDSQRLDMVNLSDNFAVYSEWDWTRDQIFIHSLLLNELILTLEQQNYKKALPQLESLLKLREIWMGKESNHNLFSAMIGVAMRAYIDQYFEGLLTSGYLTPILNQPVVEKLLAPYTKDEREKVIQAIISEYQWSLSNYNLRPYINNFSADQVPTLNEKDEFVALNYLMTLGYMIPPAMQNRFTELKKIPQLIYPRSWLIFTRSDHIGFQTLTEWQTIKQWHEDYFARKNISLSEILAFFNQHYPIIPSLNVGYKYLDAYQSAINSDNYANEIEEWVNACHTNSKSSAELYDSSRAAIDYLRRFDEQSIYHTLVYLKFLIIKDKIKDKNIPKFLASKAEYTKHPFRDEFIQWNPEKRTLSIPLSEAKKWLPANVRNSDATHWIVTIPQQ